MLGKKTCIYMPGSGPLLFSITVVPRHVEDDLKRAAGVVGTTMNTQAIPYKAGHAFLRPPHPMKNTLRGAPRIDGLLMRVVIDLSLYCRVYNRCIRRIVSGNAHVCDSKRAIEKRGKRYISVAAGVFLFVLPCSGWSRVSRSEGRMFSVF